ncbi:hypothetical protein GQ42DRAFT_162063 [Ramicandelaber brevisporus]|nr:hypothetical protein GQ42DRAFT_162063 [Ramicandelaber brevisporus]
MPVQDFTLAAKPPKVSYSSLDSASPHFFEFSGGGPDGMDCIQQQHQHSGGMMMHSSFASAISAAASSALATPSGITTASRGPSPAMSIGGGVGGGASTAATDTSSEAGHSTNPFDPMANMVNADNDIAAVVAAQSSSTDAAIAAAAAAVKSMSVGTNSVLHTGRRKHIIGVCAMDKKSRSKPMSNILNALIKLGDYEAIIFGEKVIIDEPVERWPRCDVLIAFFSNGFPLDKAIEYVRLRQPFCVNNLSMQKVLWDRRLVMSVLDALGVQTPRRLIASRDGGPKVSMEVSDFIFNRTGHRIGILTDEENNRCSNCGHLHGYVKISHLQHQQQNPHAHLTQSHPSLLSQHAHSALTNAAATKHANDLLYCCLHQRKHSAASSADMTGLTAVTPSTPHTPRTPRTPQTPGSEDVPSVCAPLSPMRSSTATAVGHAELGTRIRGHSGTAALGHSTGLVTESGVKAAVPVPVPVPASVPVGSSSLFSSATHNNSSSNSNSLSKTTVSQVASSASMPNTAHTTQSEHTDSTAMAPTTSSVTAPTAPAVATAVPAQLILPASYAPSTAARHQSNPYPLWNGNQNVTGVAAATTAATTAAECFPSTAKRGSMCESSTSASTLAHNSNNNNARGTQTPPAGWPSCGMPTVCVCSICGNSTCCRSPSHGDSAAAIPHQQHPPLPPLIRYSSTSRLSSLMIPPSSSTMPSICADHFTPQPPSVVRMLDEDTVEIDGQIIRKPFVEKPVNGDDHNIYIYYSSEQGGGVRKLFRKVANKSSEFFPDLWEIRTDGSYLYEEFVDVENSEDVKVYTVGQDYAHSETRKSPVVDGVVKRNADGKEVRYAAELSPIERANALRIAQAFGQQVCGLDMLRTEDDGINGRRSLVIDVNGWSFVKGSSDYYERCAQILHAMFLDAVQRQMRSMFVWREPSYENPWVLKGFVSVFRHADRTPKQKLKFGFMSPPFVELLGTAREEIILRDHRDLERVQRAANLALANGLENKREIELLLAVLGRKIDMAGTKVQLKPSFEKPHKLTGAPGKLRKLQLILKWGGECTHAGIHQTKDLAENMHKDLAILNRQLLRDVRVYSGSERRIVATAEAFCEKLFGFSRVPSGCIAIRKDMLDDSNAAKDQMDAVKQRLKAAFEEGCGIDPSTFTTPSLTVGDIDLNSSSGGEFDEGMVPLTPAASSISSESVPPSEVATIVREMPAEMARDPLQFVREIYFLLRELCRTMKGNFERLGSDGIASLQEVWCCGETPELFRERWEKILRDFGCVAAGFESTIDGAITAVAEKFDPTKVAELYDSLKYDALHNREFLEGIFVPQFIHDEERQQHQQRRVLAAMEAYEAMDVQQSPASVHSCKQTPAQQPSQHPLPHHQRDDSSSSQTSITPGVSDAGVSESVLAPVAESPSAGIRSNRARRSLSVSGRRIFMSPLRTRAPLPSRAVSGSGVIAPASLAAAPHDPTPIAVRPSPSNGVNAAVSSLGLLSDTAATMPDALGGGGVSALNLNVLANSSGASSFGASNLGLVGKAPSFTGGRSSGTVNGNSGSSRPLIAHARRGSDSYLIIPDELEPVRELYHRAKVLFDYIAPREYGITDQEKNEIGVLTSVPLLRQIINDIERAADIIPESDSLAKSEQGNDEQVSSASASPTPQVKSSSLDAASVSGTATPDTPFAPPTIDVKPQAPIPAPQPTSSTAAMQPTRSGRDGGGSGGSGGSGFSSSVPLASANGSINNHPFTSLYFTKESHVHTFLNVIFQSGLPTRFNPGDIEELDYLTQITIEIYEKPANPHTGEPKELSLRLGFSPGAHHSNVIDVQADTEHHCLNVAQRRDLTPHMPLDLALSQLKQLLP